MPSGTKLEPGTEIAGYRIESPLGRGGMGAVYVATHLRLGRRDALKVLMPELAEDAGFRERFIRESQLAASLEHPNIIPIYDADEEDGYLFIAMRYVAGSDLKGMIDRKGRLSPQEVLPIIEQAGAALDAAHAAGLVHRDVKPANILVDERNGHVYLTDFGIAKSAGAAGLTRTGSFVGTVDYCAPEQIEGKPVDGRTDVYALGCVLYQCVTGQPPYPKDSDVAVIHAHLAEPPPAASTKQPDLPQALDGVLVTAMAKYPDVRFATCTALADALKAAIDGAPAPAKPTVAATSPPPPAAPPPLAAPQAPAPPAFVPQTDATVVPPSVRRRRWLLWAGGGGLLAAVGGAAAALALVLAGGGSDNGTTTAPPTTGPIVAGTLGPAARIVSSVVAPQELVNARVRELRADRPSFDRLRAAGAGLERVVSSAQARVEHLRPEQTAGEFVKPSLRATLAAHASYARLLASLPRPSEFTKDYANSILNLAQATEESYANVLRLGEGLPQVPISRATDERLLDIAQRAQSPGVEDELRAFAADVQALLVESSQARSELRAALMGAGQCTLSYAAAAQRVQRVATERQRLAADISALDAPTSAARRAAMLLMRAADHSLASNLHYRDWLLALDATTKKCSPRAAPPTADLTAAQREDVQASAAKRAFLKAYNPLARRFGLRAWKETEV
jgi:predicted Ser/Thr protein kinase